MAKLIPLPRIEELPEVVLFHRNHPSDQRLMLQVPTGPETAETYIIRLDQRKPEAGKYDPRLDHKGWIKRLPNSQALTDLLMYEMHVAYYPHKGGTVMKLDDPDTIPYMTQVVALARRSRTTPFDKLLKRRTQRTRLVAPMSSFRQSLMRRPGGMTW